MGNRITSLNVYWDFLDIPKSLKDLVLNNGGKSRAELSFPEIWGENCSSLFLGFCSGRAVLSFALQAFSELCPDANEVILPLYVCNGVVDPILKGGLIPVFCDIGQDLNISVDSCINKISSKTLAIVVPHTYGFPGNIEEVIQRAKAINPGVLVIDDAASGMGNLGANDPLGLSGDVGIFSFNQAKPFVATGGGLLAVNRSDLKDVFLKKYRGILPLKQREKFCEVLRFAWNFYLPHLSRYGNYYLEKFLKSKALLYKPSYGRGLSSFDLFLVRNGIEKCKLVQEKRQEIVSFYLENLKGLPGLVFPQMPDGQYFSRFSVRVQGLAGLKRRTDSGLSQAFDGAKIQIQYGYSSSFARDYVEEGEFSESFKLIDELMVLPVNHRIPVQDYSRVVDLLKSIGRLI